jgi:hypothetical protein
VPQELFYHKAVVAFILHHLAMLSSPPILHKATAVSDMTTSSLAHPFTVSSFPTSIIPTAPPTTTKATALTAGPLPTATIIHFAASNITTATPVADDAINTGAIHITTTDSLLLATNCLSLAIHLAAACATTAAAAASPTTTCLLLPTHLDTNFTPATATNPLNTTLMLIVIQFNEACLVTIMPHVAVIISSVTMVAVDASTSLLTFFHAYDSAFDEVHVNPTINAMVLLSVSRHFGPFTHYLTIHGCYFSRVTSWPSNSMVLCTQPVVSCFYSSFTAFLTHHKQTIMFTEAISHSLV